MNYGQCVSHEFVRMAIHDSIELEGPLDATNVFNLRAKTKEDGVEGWSVTVSNLDQINEITRILDENLQQGAIGVGCTPGYASEGISTYEQFEVQRAAARYKRLCAFHTRLHTSTKPPPEITEKDAGRTMVVFNPPREKWLPYWLKTPHMTVGSDAMWTMGTQA